MTEKLNIVQSTTEPDKRNIWFKDNELKKFGAKGWSTIGGSNAGGDGTSTDKDALYISIDPLTYNITINDKVYIASLQGGSTGTELTITNKELYDKLYNFLYGTNRNIYFKSLSTDGVYLFGICVSGHIDKSIITLSFFTGAAFMSIIVINQ